MANDQDKAPADVPAEPTDDLDLEAMGLVDDEEPLTESEQVARAAAKARPTRKKVEEPTSGKGKRRGSAKRKRGGDGEGHHRTTPVQFVGESVAELKKVVWPTLTQLRQYFVVVLVFVLIMIAIVALLDLGFGAAMLKIFG